MNHFFFFLKKDLFIYFTLFFGCDGSLLLHVGLLQLWRMGHIPCGSGLLTLVASLVVEHKHMEFSGCPICAEQLWHRGLFALQCVESFRIKDETGVPCIARWILYHWTSRETPKTTFDTFDQSQHILHTLHNFFFSFGFLPFLKS